MVGWTSRAVAVGAAVSLAGLAAGCATDASPGAAPSPSATCPPTAPGDDGALSAGLLCGMDGRAWSDSVYTFIVETPAWDADSQECLDAQQASYWDGWRETQGNVVTIDLDDAEGGLVGSSGTAVLDSDDPQAIVDALDATVRICAGPSQTALDHGPWHGVTGPTSESEDADVRWSWWTASDDRWAFVQVYSATDASDADVAELEDAMTTLLDAQAELLQS